MTPDKEKIWEQATMKAYADNPMGDNWDRISIALDLYAECEVKKLSKAIVRGQLLAFLKWLQKQDMNKALITLVDEYEKASNLPIMDQVYEQKKRLPQTSIEELKGIKNKN